MKWYQLQLVNRGWKKDLPEQKRNKKKLEKWIFLFKFIFPEFSWNLRLLVDLVTFTQRAFTCSKLAIEKLAQGVKFVQS